MKIVVIGGTGLIGSKLVKKLKEFGHDVIPASPTLGVNSVTGEGLTEAFTGVDVVVDVANSPSYEDNDAMDFFETSSRNILEAGEKAGIGHHIALSVVGTERLLESGYFRAKMAQEKLIRESGTPYTIIHSTQFFEILGTIAQSGSRGKSVHLSPALIQPIASEDVADIMATITLGDPFNNALEIAGPDRFKLSDLMQTYFSETNDDRVVVSDVSARYFGAELNNDTLVPGKNPYIGKINIDQWFRLQSKIN